MFENGFIEVLNRETAENISLKYNYYDLKEKLYENESCNVFVRYKFLTNRWEAKDHENLNDYLNSKEYENDIKNLNERLKYENV